MGQSKTPNCAYWRQQRSALSAADNSRGGRAGRLNLVFIRMLSDRRWLSNDLLWPRRSEIQSRLWDDERSFYLCTSIRAECVVGLTRVRMVECIGSFGAEVVRSSY